MSQRKRVEFTEIMHKPAKEAKPGEAIWRAIDLSKVRAIELHKAWNEAYDEAYYFAFLVGDELETFVTSKTFKSPKEAMEWLELKIRAWNEEQKEV